jgi:regulatory factor X
MMQQQFFTLSPMPGQESFSNLEVRSSQSAMAHTPTTSAMLAALQDFPAGAMDSSSAFNSDAYSALAYMDTTAISQDDSVTPAQQSSVSFPDYVAGSANPFEVGAFTPQELGMTAHTPAASEPEHDSDVVKTEGSA